jgi:hypothetical protein
MKYFFCTLIFLISLATTQAQSTFAPIGATWVYKYTSSNGAVSTCSLTSVNDTIVNGKQCKKIVSDCGGCSWPQYNILYSENNVIYFYNPNTNSFAVLYDFNKTVGQTYTTKLDIDSVVFKIDSIGTIDINGYNLKKMYTHVTHHPSFLEVYSGISIENIGHVGFFFPWDNASCVEGSVTVGQSVPGPGPLGCYSDTIIGLYSTGKIPDCTTNKIKNPPIVNVLKIYPNPNDGSFTLTIDSGITNLSFYNAIGQLIQSQSYSGVAANFNIELITKAKGIYFLKVQSEKSTTTKKIIVE